MALPPQPALSTEEWTSYRFGGYCANMKSWRYCLNFAQFRKDCNVSCSSCARRVNTTHFSGSSFPTIVKTISREGNIWDNISRNVISYKDIDCYSMGWGSSHMLMLTALHIGCVFYTLSHYRWQHRWYQVIHRVTLGRKKEAISLRLKISCFKWLWKIVTL